MITSEQRSEIIKTLEDFDFETVHKVMEFLNWSWNDLGVPTHTKLIIRSMSLLEQAIESASNRGNRRGVVCSGGLSAIAFFREDNTLDLSLAFELVQAQNHYDQ